MVNLIKDKIIKKTPSVITTKYSVFFLDNATGVVYVSSNSPQYVSGQIRMLGRKNGQYPVGYKKMLEEIFGMCSSYGEEIEVCSGWVKNGPKLITVDLNPDRNSVNVGDGQSLPVDWSNRFERWYCDPPYNKRTAEKMYGTMFPSWSKLLTEGARVTKPGGLLFLLLGDVNLQWHPEGTTRIGWLVLSIVPNQETRFDKAFAKMRVDNIRNNRQEYIKRNKEKIEADILIIVLVYGHWGGVFPNQIAEILGMDKSNVITYTKSLEKKGKITRRNIQSPYLPIDESFKNLALEAYLFGESSLRLLKSTKKNLILVNEETQTPSKFDIYKKYYEPSFTKEDYLERALFEFSNRIGAFITRAVIEATRASNYNTRSSIIKSTDMQNSITQAYMRKAISSLIPSLIPIFKKLVKRIPELRSKFYEQSGQNKYSWKCPNCNQYEEDSDISKLTQVVTIHENKTGHKYDEQYFLDNRQFSLKKDERGNFLFTDKITL